MIDDERCKRFKFQTSLSQTLSIEHQSSQERKDLEHLKGIFTEDEILGLSASCVNTC